MNFLHPEAFYLLILLLIFFIFIILKKESKKNFFSQDILKRLQVKGAGLSLKGRNILFFISGIFMVIALAQPVINDGVIKIKAKSADIMVALDISDSMLAQDIYPNRLKLAKQKALKLLKNAPKERIGVVAFAKNSYLVSPLSFDHEAVSFLLRKLDTNSITQQGTDFLSILDVINNTQNKKNKKYLLILTDGGDKKDFSQEIAQAKQHGIVVFILGIGTKKGSPIKLENGDFIKENGKIIISKLNESISELAIKSGGVYIQSTKSDKDIKTMINEIKNKSTQKELKSQDIKKHIQLFYYPLGVAILFLLLATSSFVRINKNIVALFSVIFMLNSSHVEAGMLDFMDLDKAKKAYENKEYEKSAKLYEKYANESKDPKANYNYANTLYKQKKYKEALKAYEKANFEDKNLNAKKLSNIGNTYAKQGSPQDLQKAIESYEASLKLKEDKLTRENLEEVKKHLKKNNQQKQNNKNDSKKDNKKSNDKNQQNKNSKSNDNKKSDKKDQSNKDKNSDKSNQDSDKQNNKSKDKKSSSKSQQSKDNKNNSEKPKSKEESQEKNQNKNKQDLKNLSKTKGEKKDKKDKRKASSASQADKQISAKKMSDKEEAKWLNELNSQKNTYIYKLENSKSKKENTDEKPW